MEILTAYVKANAARGTSSLWSGLLSDPGSGEISHGIWHGLIEVVVHEWGKSKGRAEPGGAGCG